MSKEQKELRNQLVDVAEKLGTAKHDEIIKKLTELKNKVDNDNWFKNLTDDIALFLSSKKKKISKLIDDIFELDFTKTSPEKKQVIKDFIQWLLNLYNTTFFNRIVEVLKCL